ncbi:hypothetical protein BH10PSE17_BH10PSE17_32610 [soil metagenome]
MNSMSGYGGADRQARENAELTQLRMRQCATMLGEFAAQMNVVAPRVSHTFELPGVVRFTDMEIRDLFVEEREKTSGTLHGTVGSIRDSTLDYVLFSYRYTGPHRHTVIRTSPTEIERLETLLHRHRIGFDVQIQRNARAQVERAVFNIESAIAGGVKFMADDQGATIRIALRNVERLGDFGITLPAADFSQPLLEELGRCIIGMPNEFRRLAYGDRTQTTTWLNSREGPYTFSSGD